MKCKIYNFIITVSPHYLVKLKQHKTAREIWELLPK